MNIDELVMDSADVLARNLTAARLLDSDQTSRMAAEVMADLLRQFLVSLCAGLDEGMCAYLIPKVQHNMQYLEFMLERGDYYSVYDYVFNMLGGFMDACFLIGNRDWLVNDILELIYLWSNVLSRGAQQCRAASLS